MVIDQDIQTSGLLSVQQGSSINKVLPDFFSYGLGGGALHTYIKGAPYSGAMVKIERPLLPCSGKLTLCFSLCPDACAEELAQVYEHDLRVTIGGLTYLFDLQNNIAEGGMLQVGTGAAWLDSGVKLGIPQGSEWTRWTDYRFACVLDQAAKTSQAVSATVNDGDPMMLTVPAQAAQALGWGDGVVFQNQRCLNGRGGVMSDAARISIEWE